MWVGKTRGGLGRPRSPPSLWALVWGSGRDRWALWLFRKNTGCSQEGMGGEEGSKEVSWRLSESQKEAEGAWQ